MPASPPAPLPISLRCGGAGVRASSAAVEGEQLVERLVEALGEQVGVGQRLAIGVDAEEGLVADRRHPDRERVAVGERHDRIGLLELAAEHVQRLARPGDVRDDEVERARARRPGVRAARWSGSRRVADRVQRAVRALAARPLPCGPLVSSWTGRRRARVGLVARQVDEHERDPVARARPRRRSRRTFTGHHRLQRQRLLAAPSWKSRRTRRAEAASTTSLTVASEAPLDPLQVVQRATRPGQMATRARSAR